MKKCKAKSKTCLEKLKKGAHTESDAAGILFADNNRQMIK